MAAKSSNFGFRYAILYPGVNSRAELSPRGIFKTDLNTLNNVQRNLRTLSKKLNKQYSSYILAPNSSSLSQPAILKNENATKVYESTKSLSDDVGGLRITHVSKLWLAFHRPGTTMSIQHEYDNLSTTMSIQHEYDNLSTTMSIQHEYDNFSTTMSIQHEYDNFSTTMSIQHEYDNLSTTSYVNTTWVGQSQYNYVDTTWVWQSEHNYVNCNTTWVWQSQHNYVNTTWVWQSQYNYVNCNTTWVWQSQHNYVNTTWVWQSQHYVNTTWVWQSQHNNAEIILFHIHITSNLYENTLLYVLWFHNTYYIY